MRIDQGESRSIDQGISSQVKSVQFIQGSLSKPAQVHPGKVCTGRVRVVVSMIG